MMGSKYTVSYFLPVLPPRSLDEITKEDFSYVLDVNVLGEFLVTKVHYRLRICPYLTLMMDSYNLLWQIFAKYTVSYFLPVLPPRTLDEITKEEFSHVLDVNILGAFLVSKVIQIIE